MACADALIENPTVLHPDMTVEEALTLLEEQQIRCAPVVDSNQSLVGMFGLHSLMEDMLPTAARITDGVEDLDFVMGAGPGAAKRMRKLFPRPLRDHMDSDYQTLRIDTSMLEVIRRVVKYGSPIAVVDTDGKKFLGLVSEQSCLHRMHEVLIELDEEEQAGKTA